jgi:PAS domain S-box-containing protein
MSQMTENKNANERVHTGVLAAGVNVYDWEIQAGAFTMDDFAGLLGPAAAEVRMPRESWEALLHPEDRSRTSEAFQLHLERKNSIIETEYRIRTQSGTYTWLLDRGSIVERDREGVPRRVSGVLVDISRGKKAEEVLEGHRRAAVATLQKTEGEKSAILQGLRGLVSIRYLDPNLRIMWDNIDKAQERSGEDQTTPRGYCYRIIWGRTEPCSSGCTPIEALKTGEMKEKENRMDDGRVFIERSNPVRDNAGAVRGVIFITLNVTRHRKIEERLKTADRFLHSFLENSPTPITICGRDGRIDLVNSAWERVVGLMRNQAVGQRLDEIFPSKAAKQFGRLNAEILRSGNPSELEESIEYPSGPHHFHTIKIPLRDGTGQTVGVGTISLDITALKRAEQALAKREAELKRKSRQLTETNTALRVLLSQREKDQRELEERVVANVNQLVLPYVRKLKGMRSNETQMSYLEIVETHLGDIVAPFLRQVVSQYPHMTTREIQVATLVREGKSNKDIAEIMNLSMNTVQIHRHNLRKKLGLQNKKMNLRSYLLSMNGAPK